MKTKLKYKDILTEDFLTQEYIVNKKSTVQISKETNIGKCTVIDYLKKNKITRRTISEAKIGKERSLVSRLKQSKTLKDTGIFNLPKNLKGIFNPNYKHGRHFDNHCTECNKLITHVSTKCMSCAGLLRRTGNKFLEKYTPSFTGQLKERVRVRDNFICKLCKVPELEIGRKLSIHHIDYNKKNDNINNLVSLCTSCHAKTNINRENWKERFTNGSH